MSQLLTEQVFLEVCGSPFKRNQDLVLRIVLEDWDWILDLVCDYRTSTFIPQVLHRVDKAILYTAFETRFLGEVPLWQEGRV